MARGWESKEVESQIESAAERRRPDQESPLSAQTARVESLRLQKKRIEHDLARATHPNHRATLEQALAHLNEQIAVNSRDAS